MQRALPNACLVCRSGCRRPRIPPPPSRPVRRLRASRERDAEAGGGAPVVEEVAEAGVGPQTPRIAEEAGVASHAPRGAEEAGVALALALLRFYREQLSPLMPRSCRFVPSCSEYSIASFKAFGFWRGGLLTAFRLLRCNPLNPRSGYDPPRWPPRWSVEESET